MPQRIDWTVPEKRCKAAQQIAAHVHPEDLEAVQARLAAGTPKNWCAARIADLDDISANPQTIVTHMDGRCMCNGLEEPLHGVTADG